MKRAALLFLAAMLTCGFLVQTPKERREIERRARGWKKEVAARFDLDALTRFLQAAIAAKTSAGGVDLSQSQVGARWEFGGCWMKSGDWTFLADDPKADTFSLQFLHSGGTRLFLWECVREGKTSFRVLRSRDEEVVVLELE